MDISDCKDTVEIDNVTREFLDRLKHNINHFEPEDVTDIIALRFAVLFISGALAKIRLEGEIAEVLAHALALAREDPAIVEQDLFRS
ncbi:hypothetical protein LCGC14_2476090 [marine sediment metagenome]|uniref:Uncharacterized protein n=1 Tax=marine sediment metagenome TaxID=412755 RepID=A0A0F9B8U8_9ZZZZ